MSDLRVLMMVEQLRRTASGGIGTYVRGLIQGPRLAPDAENRPDIELVASRRPGGRRAPTPWPAWATRCTALLFPGRC